MRALTTLMAVVILCALSLGLGLGGCASAGAPEFTVSPGGYAAAFDASREVLREYKFQLERVDSAGGVITTQAKDTAGLATPWDPEQTTMGQEVEDLLDQQRRRVRITFAALSPAAAPEEDRAGPMETDGPVLARVEVMVYRIQTPGLRPPSKAISLTTVTIDPSQAPLGIGWQYEVPVSQDSRLAARLARDIGRRMEKAGRAHAKESPNPTNLTPRT